MATAIARDAASNRVDAGQRHSTRAGGIGLQTVGFAYPGSNPVLFRISRNSLLISPCTGEGLVPCCPAETGQLRLARANMWRSLTLAFVSSPPQKVCIGFQLIWSPGPPIQRCSTLLRRDLSAIASGAGLVAPVQLNLPVGHTLR